MEFWNEQLADLLLTNLNELPSAVGFTALHAHLI